MIYGNERTGMYGQTTETAAAVVVVIVPVVLRRMSQEWPTN